MRRYSKLGPVDLARGRFSIRPVSDGDIEAIRRWRNAQMRVLRQAQPISPKAQCAYFAERIWPQMERSDPENVLVTILRDGVPVGYGGLVHCSWNDRRAEISALFAPEVAAEADEYRVSLMTFLELICALGFDRLGFNRLTLETYDIRPAHIAILEEAGFIREGRQREHVIIDGDRVDSLLHAMVARDYRAICAMGGRTTSDATRAILMPESGGS